MTTLNDLRVTLDEHAEGLHDTDLHARPVAVRARVRVARRRRAGAVAAAAIVVLVAAVAVTGALHGPRTVEPAGRVVGVDVPSSIDVLGFPYDLESTESDSSVKLDGGATERAVSLVGHDLGSGSATLFSDGTAVARVRGDEQVAAAYPVGVGGVDLTVHLDGTPDGAEAGLAIYAATGQLATGVDNGHAVFRSSVAGNRLITAAFADPGSPEVSLGFRGRLDRTSLAAHCVTSDDHLWLNVTVDGTRFMGGSCATDSGADAGTTSYTSDRTSPGSHHVEAYLTAGDGGPRLASFDGTIGIAAYAEEAPAEHSHGADVDRTVEYAGRTWTLDRVEDADRASVDTRSGDLLLAFLGAGDQAWTTWRGDLSRGTSDSVGGGDAGSTGFLTSGVLLAGDRYDVRLHTTGANAGGALLVYRPE
jgi:hypothetical protein